MLFQTLTFLIFFTCLLLILAMFRGKQAQKIVLLTASCIFYMWWNPYFILLLLMPTLVDFRVSLWMYKTGHQPTRRRLLYLTLISNLGILAFFKYFNFFEANVLWGLRAFGIEPSWITLNIILPVGISFYTFQTMSYTIDVYRKELEPTSSLLDFALFITFFPQLVAGPIVRASNFMPQINAARVISFATPSLLLVLNGLVKKVVVADNLGRFVNTIYAVPGGYPSLIIWLATLCFAIQIYCDFSGYTDMAIGIAAILGFSFPPNFNRPYFAITPSEFWQRWHISLSSWLRDYLYIPRGGNRQGTFLTMRNLMTTMVLGGLWHGASWNFVLWGFLHGLILIIYRALNLDKFLKTSGHTIYCIVFWAFLQYYILVTWIIFRQTDTALMLMTLKKFILFDFNVSLASIGLGRLSFFSTLLIFLFFLTMHIWSWLAGSVDKRWSTFEVGKLCVYLFVVGILVFFFWPTQEMPFIYFQF